MSSIKDGKNGIFGEKDKSIIGGWVLEKVKGATGEEILADYFSAVKSIVVNELKDGQYDELR